MMAAAPEESNSGNKRKRDFDDPSLSRDALARRPKPRLPDFSKKTSTYRSKLISECCKMFPFKAFSDNHSNATDMVKFEIGRENVESFNVHKEFVCYFSPVLDAAFNSSFQEGLTGTYRMEDADPNAFRIFLHWCYSHKRLDTVHLLEKHVERLRPQRTELDPIHLTKAARSALEQDLYSVCFLADRLIVPQLYNAAIMALEGIFKHFKSPSSRSMAYVWDNTKPESTLRKLLIDTCAWYAYTQKWPSLNRAEDFPHEMLFELVRVLGIKASRGDTNRGFLIFRDSDGYCLPVPEEDD